MSQASIASDTSESTDIDSSPLSISSGSSSLELSSLSIASVSTRKPKRPRTSWVYHHMPHEDPEHRYFGKKGSEEWRCRYCSKAYSCNGGTRVIKDHLVDIHNIEDSSARATVSLKRQLTIEKTLSNGKPTKRRRLSPSGDTLNPDVLEALFIRLLSTADLPLQLVQHPDFRDFLYYLNSDIDSWLITSHTTAKTWLLRQYEMQKARIKGMIQNARTRIHLTLDCWTSPNHLPILGVIAHYISSEKKLEKSVLALRQIDGAHTGENLAGLVYRVVQEFDFASNLGYFQADNATNNDTTAGELSSSKYRLIPSFQALL